MSKECLVPTSDKQLSQYRVLVQLSKAVSSYTAVGALLGAMAAELHEIFEFDDLALLLHNQERNAFRFHILETNPPAARTFPPEVPVEGSISGQVWLSQKPFVTPDIQSDSAYSSSPFITGLPVRSVCVLPLSTAQERLGTLAFACEKPNAYDDLDLEFAGLVSTQIAIALQSGCQHQKLARQRDRSELLLEINNMLVSNRNLRELLAALSTALRRAVPHDSAGLALFDPAVNQLRLSALEFPANEDFFLEGELVPTDGAAARAFETGEILLTDVRDANDPLGRRFVAAGMVSGCVVPLASRGRRLGVLGLASAVENAFSPEDAQFLGEVGKQIAIAVDNALAYREIEMLRSRLEGEKLYLEEEIRAEHTFDEIVGGSPALKRVLHQVRTVAATESTVLICGETGTGKELIARAIHNLSARRSHTLVKVNCGAIPTGLLESEMFGHERGAFTGAIERRIGRFETADGGTIFLDEVEDIPLELQPKLLRVLQEQEFERLGSSKTIRVNLRVVAAANVDLAEMVGEKRFRSDLYYRLNVFPIVVPPLRERPEDIPLLAQFFASKFAHRMKKPIESISRDAMERLISYKWPGNIRELQNLIERAVILTRVRTLDIPIPELQTFPAPSAINESRSLAAVERNHILRVLEDSNWVIGGNRGAASRLGMNRTTLNHRMRKLGIVRPQG